MAILIYSPSPSPIARADRDLARYRALRLQRTGQDLLQSTHYPALMAGLRVCYAEQYAPVSSNTLDVALRALVSDGAVMARHDTLVRWHKAQALWEALWLWVGADAGVMHDIGAGTLAPAQDGETVRAWFNRRSATLDFGQTIGANQPMYEADALTGKRAVVSAGVTEGMRINSVPTWTPPFTLVVYGRDLATAGGGSQRAVTRLGWPSAYIFQGNSLGVMSLWQWYSSTGTTFSSGISGVGKAVWGLVVDAGLNVWIYHTSTGLVWIGTAALASVGQIINIFDEGGSGARASGQLASWMLYKAALAEPQLVALDGVLQSEYVL